ARGGMVSHAAVVARGWGIPAVVGAGRIDIDGDAVHVGRRTLRAGDEITIDGSSGKVYLGILDTAGADAPPELETLLAWADAIAAGSVQVRANADTEGDASQGRKLGAQGIGLCRTEHMFLAADRLPIMRRFIMARSPDAEQVALAELEQAQTADFETLLEAMDGLPVTVRLLDPPLHEFLPDLVELTARDARGELDESEQVELSCLRRLREANPMIGTRGVRLGVVRTGLYEMQVRALCQAAANLFARGKRPHVEIMIPLVIEAEELRIARGWVRDVLDEIGHPELKSSVITVGAMIETPRAALTAGGLAKHADFFSFGTNDLTQMTYAFSRDDVEAKLLPAYLAAGILPANPFAVLDQEGVGELVRIACRQARAAKPNIKLGACGEHAGHPDSAAFLVGLGLDSVSCSPFRVPLARLGVAQALLASGRVRISDIEFDLESAPSGATEHAGEMDDTQPLAVDEALVLHTLRVRGFVTPDGFRESLGTYPADIVADLVAAGQVRHIEKRDMYGLLPPGKERQEALIDSYAGPDVQARLKAHYDRFLELNEVFKQLCTDWQVRGDAQNDHTDAAYDADCIARLGQLCADSHPTIEGFAAALPRMARYAPRLDESAARVAAGETKLFTGVMCGSFHDVWMELHEDLIVLLRINRVEEGSF
ncbi:MAG TPA: putative PEP-binding protein, partial [Ilumatobacter sp.]|nr:putative PEP-binding protein [Ilumatobacter sp.]